MSKKSSRVKHKQQRTRQLSIIGVILLVVFGAGLVLATMPESAPPEVADDRLELDPILGEPDASVTVVEYGAYGCTACRAFHQRGVIDRLLNDYAGQVNFTFRDFPVIVPEYDRTAAQVAQCTLDQGDEAFWALHNVLYSVVPIGSDQDTLIDYAATVGVDAGALRTCFDAGTHRQTVQYDQDRAYDLGFRGTPVFTVNDERVFSPSEQNLRDAIDRVLSS
jgi:protein-disulfide isomerase